jgi:hypothetical protein
MALEEGTGAVAAPPQTMADAFEAAEKETGVNFDTEAAVVPIEPASAPENAGVDPGKTPQETTDPDHIRWAKSVQGDFDAATGQFNTDRIVKRSYELNSFSQNLARENAELRKSLQQQQELASRKDGKPEVAAEEPREKTDAEILDEMVVAKANEVLKPHVEVLAQLEERYVNDACLTAKSQLQEYYGKTVVPDGKGGQQEVYVYDAILPEIGNAVQGYLQANNIEPKAFFKQMVRSNTLIPTFQSLANAILMPRLQAQLNGKQQTQAKAEVDQVKQQAELERQKAAVLPKRGSPTGEVTQTKVVNSIHDAARLAEEELGYRFGN